MVKYRSLAYGWMPIHQRTYEQMKKILLVEDNVDLAADIEETLQIEGYTVFLAYNGQEALTIIHDSRPDIVISDNKMPIMSGLELLISIKSDDQLKSIPFILMTADADEHIIELGMNTGASTVIKKPLALIQLLKTIGDILSNRNVALQ